jgi:hypothetical protein
MGQINFNITFTIDGDGSPTCVNVWAGIEKTRNCCGLPYIPNVSNWTRQCFTVITNQANTVNGSINVTGEELELCNPNLKIIVQACCFQSLTDCTQTPVGPPNLIPGQYVEYTTPIGNLAGSQCKRYIIGKVNGGPAFPDITMQYKPCPPTDMSLCNNQNGYEPQIQTIQFTANELSQIEVLPQTITNNETLVTRRYLEFCSSINPILTTTINGQQVALIAGIDYAIVQLENWNISTNECCHKCDKFGYCYYPAQAASGPLYQINALFLFQDCNTGTLIKYPKVFQLNPNGEERCIIKGTGHLIYLSGAPVNIGYPTPIPTTTTHAALNLFADYSCCITNNCPSSPSTQ